MAKTNYIIFLAASNELSEDREKFSAIVTALDMMMHEQGKQVQLLLYKWEDDLASFAERRKQDVYNDNIGRCAIFVMLYGSKVGAFTEEEFDFAYEQFKASGMPQVLIFKKSGIAPSDDSVQRFEDKIRNLHEQFKPYYRVADDLKNAVIGEVGKYFSRGILQPGRPAEPLYNEGQAVPANFKGREKELVYIRKKLDEGGKLMLINAEGGIGKTALAAKYWHDSLHHYRYNAWLFCQNGIVKELKKLAPKLDIDLSNKTEEKQLALLKDGLRRVADGCLLVLDNADMAGDIEAFRQEFRGFHWHVLITSRRTGVLDKNQEYLIEHLPPEVATALFKDCYDEHTPEFDEVLARFLERIGYHTLLVEVFSKFMDKLETDETLAGILEQLEQKGLFLGRRGDVSTEWQRSHGQHAAADTNRILNALYDFSELSEEERHCLVNVALLPAVAHRFTFLCTLLGQDSESFGILKQLAGRGWLGFADRHYRISPVIQQIALEKNKATLAADAAGMVEVLNEKLENDGTYLRHFNAAGPYAALADDIVRHLRHAPFYALSLLANNACVYFGSAGNLSAALAAAESYKAMNELMGDQGGLAISYGRLGGIYEKQGRLEEALKQYGEYSKLSESLHRDYPGDVSFKRGLAVSYSKLGGIYEKRGRLDEALKQYGEDLKLSESLHRDYPGDVSFKRGLAVSYSRLGGIYEKQGRLDEALKQYEEYSKLSESLHRDYPGDVSFKNGLAVSYSKLGGIYEKQGRLEEALKQYEEYSKLSESLHRDYPGDVSFKNGLAVSYSKLGGIYEKQGRLEEALKQYGEYSKLSESLHRDYPGEVSFKNGLAVSYEKLGGIYEKQGRLEEALKQYEERNKLGESLHRDYPGEVSFKNGLAVSYSRLGGIYEKQGRLDEALKQYEEYSKLSESLHRDYPGEVSFKNGLAVSYSRLGGIYEKQGRLDEALKQYGEYSKLSESLHRDYPGDVSFKNGLAISCACLAQCQVARGNRVGGIALYRRAETLFGQLATSYPGYQEFGKFYQLAQSRLRDLGEA